MKIVVWIGHKNKSHRILELILEKNKNNKKFNQVYI